MALFRTLRRFAVDGHVPSPHPAGKISRKRTDDLIHCLTYLMAAEPDHSPRAVRQGSTNSKKQYVSYSLFTLSYFTMYRFT